MEVCILKACEKEIAKFPAQIKEDLVEAISDLTSDLILSMPLARRMGGMGRGVWELRLKDTSGIYRVIYLVKKSDAIYLIHAFKKKSTKTSKKNICLAMTRIKRLR